MPATVLEKLGWQPGHRLLLEQTDDGMPVMEIEAPGDAGALKAGSFSSASLVLIP